MTLRPCRTLAPVLVGLFLSAASGGAALAQGGADGSPENWSFFATGGAGVAPEFPGADSYEPVPVVAARAERGGFVVETDRIGLRADVLPLPELVAGPLIRFSFGRDDVDDAAVDALDTVDPGLALGFVLGWQSANGVLMERDQVAFQIAFARELGFGHGGTTVEAGLSYARPLTDRLRGSVAVSSTYADNSFMDAFFGVTGAGAAASGLSTFDPGAGIKDVGVGGTLSYSVTRSISVTAIGSYTRLVGDAADSPIVTEGGSADQFFGGVGVGYRF